MVSCLWRLFILFSTYMHALTPQVLTLYSQPVPALHSGISLVMDNDQLGDVHNQIGIHYGDCIACMQYCTAWQVVRLPYYFSTDAQLRYATSCPCASMCKGEQEVGDSMPDQGQIQSEPPNVQQTVGAERDKFVHTTTASQVAHFSIISNNQQVFASLYNMYNMLTYVGKQCIILSICLITSYHQAWCIYIYTGLTQHTSSEWFYIYMPMSVVPYSVPIVCFLARLNCTIKSVNVSVNSNGPQWRNGQRCNCSTLYLRFFVACLIQMSPWWYGINQAMQLVTQYSIQHLLNWDGPLFYSQCCGPSMHYW